MQDLKGAYGMEFFSTPLFHGKWPAPALSENAKKVRIRDP
jgi:hypothetical protein